MIVSYFCAIVARDWNQVEPKRVKKIHKRAFLVLLSFLKPIVCARRLLKNFEPPVAWLNVLYISLQIYWWSNWSCLFDCLQSWAKYGFLEIFSQKKVFVASSKDVTFFCTSQRLKSSLLWSGTIWYDWCWSKQSFLISKRIVTCRFQKNILLAILFFLLESRT